MADHQREVDQQRLWERSPRHAGCWQSSIDQGRGPWPEAFSVPFQKTEWRHSFPPLQPKSTHTLQLPLYQFQPPMWRRMELPAAGKWSCFPGPWAWRWAELSNTNCTRLGPHECCSFNCTAWVDLSYLSPGADQSSGRERERERKRREKERERGEGKRRKEGEGRKCGWEEEGRAAWGGNGLKQILESKQLRMCLEEQVNGPWGSNSWRHRAKAKPGEMGLSQVTVVPEYCTKFFRFYGKNKRKPL